MITGWSSTTGTLTVNQINAQSRQYSSINTIIVEEGGCRQGSIEERVSNIANNT